VKSFSGINCSSLPLITEAGAARTKKFAGGGNPNQNKIKKL
jgi:hypothetical protein